MNDVVHVRDLVKTYGSDCVSEIAILPSADTTKPSLLINAKDAASETGFVDVNW